MLAVIGSVYTSVRQSPLNLTKTNPLRRSLCTGIPPDASVSRAFPLSSRLRLWHYKHAILQSTAFVGTSSPARLGAVEALQQSHSRFYKTTDVVVQSALVRRQRRSRLSCTDSSDDALMSEPVMGALPMRRSVCEGGLILVIAGWLTLQLLQSGRANSVEGLGLGALAIGGLLAEGSAAHAPFLHGNRLRPGATAGINLGVVALPALYGALISTNEGTGWDRWTFWVTVTSGLVGLGSVIFARRGRSFWPVSTSITGCILWAGASSMAMHSQGVLQVGLPIALLAFACQSAWHAIMGCFPGSFTAGEALVAAQGCTLVCGAVALRTLAWFHLWPDSLGLPGTGIADKQGVGQQGGVLGPMVLTELSAVASIIEALLVALLLVAAAYSALDRSPVLRPRLPTKKKSPLAPTRDALAPNSGAPSQQGPDGPILEHEHHAPDGPFPSSSRVFAFYTILVFIVAGLAPLWLCTVGGLSEHPLMWIISHMARDPVWRLGLCCYWLLLLLVALIAIPRLAANPALPPILVRKAYHLLAVAMFTPALLYQPLFLRLAFGGALVAFVLTEIVRVFGIPPFAQPLHTYLHRFTDARDSGPLVLSHFSLLLGCALPLWLTPPGPVPSLASFAGVLSIGVGDTLASVVGVKYGRTRLCKDSKKTVEGTVASFFSMLAGLLVLQWWLPGGRIQVYDLVATLTASLLEATTVQSDNIFVPIVYAAQLVIRTERF